MNKLEIVNEYLEDIEIQTLSADGFDEAIIGIVNNKIAYSIKKCINILMERDNMSELEAVEYFEFNVEGAYMGEETPIWIDDTLFE